MAQSTKLSLCMIVRDEEATLGACLESVKGLVDEMIVVDTGSHDGTKKTAEAAGANVLDHVWAYDFAAARNAALQACTGSWILMLDADERLAAGAAEAIQGALEKNDLDCGLLPLHHARSLEANVEDVVSGKERHGEPILLARLFRRTADLAWEGVIHESPKTWLQTPGRRVRALSAPIAHYGAVPDVRKALKKNERNLRLLERRCLAQPQDAFSRAFLARELVRGGRRQRALKEIERAWQEILANPQSSKAATIFVATLHAQLLLHAGRNQDTSHIIQEAQRLGAKHPNLSLLLGMSHHDQAIKEADSKQRMAELKVAEKYYSECLAWRGETFVEEMIEGSTSWFAASKRGFARLELGQFEQALRDFESALADSAEYTVAKLGKAEALIELGKAKEALLLLDALMSMKHHPVWLLTGAAFAKAGALADLGVFLDRIGPLGTEQIDPHYRARLAQLTNLRAVVKTMTELGIPLSPPEAVHERNERSQKCVEDATTLLNHGDIEAAHAQLVAAVRYEPLNADAWNSLGSLYYGAKEIGASLRCLRTARYADPKALVPTLNLAKVLQVQGQLEEAVSLTRDVLEQEPNQKEALELLKSLGVFKDQSASEQPIVLSVLVPTYDRPRTILNLLDRIALQDLSPDQFEVIVVDDGSPVPVTDQLNHVCPPYQLKLIRQENGGPGKARNRALQEARGRWIVIYNDDALPARDNLRLHLQRQQANSKPVAVLGTFDFVPDMLVYPFVELMHKTTLMFEYGKMEVRGFNGWQYLYTCNISMPREPVLQENGLDESFRHICEDSELGYRLEKRFGMGVYYDPDIRAQHDHQGGGAAGGPVVVDGEAPAQFFRDRGLDIHRYIRRQFRLGLARHRMWRKHRDESLSEVPEAQRSSEDYWLEVRARNENNVRIAELLTRQVDAVDKKGLPGAQGSEERQKAIEDLRIKVEAISNTYYQRGYLSAHHGFSEESILSAPKLQDELTSVVMPNLNGFPHLEGAVQSFREHTDGPVELIVIDNGSTDGSLEWLRKQSDVHLIEIGKNIGAPAARNRGLEVAKGQTIVFSDNDVIFTPAWRQILVQHLEAWPDIGIVGPMSDYVLPPQKTGDTPKKDESLSEFAERFHTRQQFNHRYASQLILFFMMARRSVIEKIGGFDPAYGNWGFEDNDFCVRARIAGFYLRIAKDCFIRHLGSQTSKSAKLDYRELLLQNWEVFKKKWDLDPSLPYATTIDYSSILQQTFDANKHRVPFSP